MTSGATVTSPAVTERGPRTRSHRWFAAPFWAIVAPCVVVGGVYLLPFLVDPARFPYGSDTYGYAWRAAAVHAASLDALASAAKSLGARPAHPVLIATLWGITGAPAMTWAWLTPALFSCVIALTAGTLAVEALGEPRSRAFAYAVGVGASAFVAWTAVGFVANLLLDPLALALVMVAVLLAFDRAHPLSAILLMTAAAITHYLFAAMLASILVVSWVIFALAARTGRWDATAAGARRLGWTILAGLAAGLAALGLSPQLPVRLPVVTEGSAATKTGRLATMALPLTVPAAALGGTVALAGRPAPERRWTVVALLIWTATVPASMVAWTVLHQDLPPYRSGGFALSIPILVILGVGCAVGAFRNLSPGARSTLSTAMATVVALVFLGVGAATWFTWGETPSRASEQFRQGAIVAAYVDRLPPDTPVAFVLSPHHDPLITGPMDRMLSSLPPDLLSRVSFITGPAQHSLPPYALHVSPRTVVILAGAVDSLRFPGTALGQDVTLLQGPPPTSPIVPGRIARAPGPLRATWLLVAALSVFAVAGSGWTMALRLSRLSRVAVAPVFGISGLAVGGLLVGRLGLRFDAVGSAALVALVTAAGWLAARWLRPPASAAPRPIQSAGQ